MRHGSLFSGIGGFDLAAEWMGWENVFHCEWNKFGQKVLKHYWPNSISYDDITKTDFTIHRGNIDILTGGFPCQPYSSAGKRLGKEDERHLWPEMLRAIREIAPSWVVGENVYGLVNWSGGLVFHEVQSDLEAEGYEVFPFLLPAVSVNAPHRRDRIWFVAYSKSNGWDKRGEGVNEWEKHKSQDRDSLRDKFTTDGKESDATNTNLHGCDQRNGNNEINAGEGGEYAQRDIEQSIGNGGATNTKCKGLFGGDKTRKEGNINRGNSKLWGSTSKYSQENYWQNFPTQSPICDGNDGISERLDGITFSKWRAESIKAGGNAIVPQVVYQIFKTIEEYDRSPNPKQNH